MKTKFLRVTKTVIINRFRRFKRSPFFVGRVVKKVFSVGAIAYVLSMILLAGFFAGEVLESVYGSIDVGRELGRYVLAFLFLLALARAVLDQDAAGVEQAYLTLPVKKRWLHCGRALSSLASGWVVLPVMFLVSYGLSPVFKDASVYRTVLHVAGVMLSIGATIHVALVFRSYIRQRPLNILLLAAAVIFLPWTGSALFQASEWLYVGLLEGNEERGLLICLLYGGSLLTHVWSLRQRSYLDSEEISTYGRTRTIPPPSLRIGWSMHHEIRLVVRVHSARMRALPTFFPSLGLAALPFLVDLPAGEIGFGYGLYFMGLFPTCIFILSYGHVMLSLDGLRLTRTVTMCSNEWTWLRGKLVFLILGTIATVLPAMCVLWIESPAFARPLTAFTVYAIGFGAPLTLLASMYNVTPIPVYEDDDVPEGSNWSLTRTALSLGIMLTPLIPFVWSTSTNEYVVSVAAIGVVSGGCIPLWKQALLRTWSDQGRRMTESYLSSWR